MKYNKNEISIVLSDVLIILIVIQFGNLFIFKLPNKLFLLW